jgi:hypothetical protein
LHNRTPLPLASIPAVGLELHQIKIDRPHANLSYPDGIDKLQLLRPGYTPYPDHRPLFGGRGEERAGRVEREGGERRFVRPDDVGHRQRACREEEDVAGLRVWEVKEAEPQESVDDEVDPPALVSGDVGEGTGEGYAKYKLSADGDETHIASQEDI